MYRPIRYELNKIFMAKWVYIILFLVTIYFRIEGMRYIDSDLTAHSYPILVYAEMKNYIFPFIIFIFTSFFFHEELKSNTLQISFIKGNARVKMLYTKLIVSFIFIFLFLVFLALISYFAFFIDNKIGAISLNLYDSDPKTYLDILKKTFYSLFLMLIVSIPMLLTSMYIALFIYTKLNYLIATSIFLLINNIILSVFNDSIFSKINFIYYLNNFFYIPRDRPYGEVIFTNVNDRLFSLGVLVCSVYSAVIISLILIKFKKIEM